MKELIKRLKAATTKLEKAKSADAEIEIGGSGTDAFTIVDLKSGRKIFESKKRVLDEDDPVWKKAYQAMKRAGVKTLILEDSKMTLEQWKRANAT